MLAWQFSSCHQYTRNNLDLWKNSFFHYLTENSKFFAVQMYERESFSMVNFPSRNLKIFSEHPSRTRDIAGWYVWFCNLSKREKTRDFVVLCRAIWWSVDNNCSKLMFIEDAYNHLQPGDPGPPWGHHRSWRNTTP